MYYRKTCHWQQPSLRESPCRWKSIRNSSAHNVFPNGWCISFLEKYISCWSFQIINLQLKCQFAKEQELNRSSSLFHKVTLNFLKVRLNLLKDQLQFSISQNTKLFWKSEIWWIVIQLPFPPNPPFLSQSPLQNSAEIPENLTTTTVPFGSFNKCLQRYS